MPNAPAGCSKTDLPSRPQGVRFQVPQPDAAVAAADRHALSSESEKARVQKAPTLLLFSFGERPPDRRRQRRLARSSTAMAQAMRRAESGDGEHTCCPARQHGVDGNCCSRQMPLLQARAPRPGRSCCFREGPDVDDLVLPTARSRLPSGREAEVVAAAGATAGFEDQLGGCTVAAVAQTPGAGFDSAPFAALLQAWGTTVPPTSPAQAWPAMSRDGDGSR